MYTQTMEPKNFGFLGLSLGFGHKLKKKNTPKPKKKSNLNPKTQIFLGFLD